MSIFVLVLREREEQSTAVEVDLYVRAKVRDICYLRVRLSAFRLSIQSHRQRLDDMYVSAVIV